MLRQTSKTDDCRSSEWILKTASSRGTCQSSMKREKNTPALMGFVCNSLPSRITIPRRIPTTATATTRAFSGPVTRLPTFETVSSTSTSTSTTISSSSTSTRIPTVTSITTLWLCSVYSYVPPIQVLSMKALNCILHWPLITKIDKAKPTRLACFLVCYHLQTPHRNRQCGATSITRSSSNACLDAGRRTHSYDDGNMTSLSQLTR